MYLSIPLMWQRFCYFYQLFTNAAYVLCKIPVICKVVFILPAIFWQQQMGWSYCARDNSKRRASGQCCQMKNMNFPQAGELMNCTEGWASRLHIKLGCRKGWTGGLPFSATRRPTLLSSVQPTESSCFSFGNTALQPAWPSN